jgi:hypothetical protein
MIKVTDNFLPKKAFEDLQNYCNSNEFKTIQAGEKEFLVLDTPRDLLDFLIIEDHNLVLTFIRKAHRNFDTDWRIHADNIINGYKTELASVLYINKKETENGTAFWIHDKYGKKLPKDIEPKEFDRLITEDANNLEKWTMDSVIGNQENRLLTYTSNYFHSKFPNKIEEGERIVLVCFYEKK